MATGHSEDDAILGPTDDNLTERQTGLVTDKVVEALKPCFNGLQKTLASVATGINKMGEAWANMATHNKQSDPTPSSFKRKRDEMDLGEVVEEELDYKNEEDVASLLNFATGNQKMSADDGG